MTITMDSLKNLYKDQLLEDDRLPNLTWRGDTFEIQFFAPRPLFFIQIGLLLILQMIIGCLLGVVMYYGIIRQSDKIQKFLIGYGLVIPIILSAPFYIMEKLDLRNMSFRLGINSLPLTVILGCLEAMHGFLPVASKQGVVTYALSVGMILRPKFDEKGKLIWATSSSFGQAVLVHLKWIGAFAIAFYMTMKSDFFPFPSSAPANQISLSFEIGHLYNIFVQAAMMNMTLGVSMSGVSALATQLTGLQFDGHVTDNPMLQSESVTDFWGRRWNNLIHQGLKQSIYKPVRYATGSPIAGAIAAFCVSGIMHEYVWIALFYLTSAQQRESDVAESGCCATCYCDAWFGKQLIFFCWNGVLITLEYLWGDRIAKLMSPVPSLIRSHLVVLLSLPVGHLFTADVTMSGYFVHMQQILPFIKIISLTE